MDIASTSQLKATCLCKKATITLEGLPMRSHYCHCTICQILHSAPYGLIAIYLPPKVILPDNHSEVFSTYTPDDRVEVYRCRECGVAVVSWVKQYNVWGVYVTAGITLDGKRIRPSEVPAFEGVMHMFYAERQRDVKYFLLFLFLMIGMDWLNGLDCRMQARK
jgi:hypothetical protein